MPEERCRVVDVMDLSVEGTYGRNMSSLDNALMPDSVAVFEGRLFHYTSADGLLAILRSGCLWASAASSLNDLGEVRQGWDLIRAILAAQPASKGVDLLSDFAANPLKKREDVFVLSASVAGDDAAQWRLYADEGRGYALELDGSIPLAVVSEASAVDPPSTGGLRIGYLARDHVSVSPWHRVLYTRAEVESAIGDLVVAVDAEIASIEGTTGANSEDRDFMYEVLQDNGYDALATIAHLIKSPGFAGENEVRVVVTFLMGDGHVRYRASPNGVVGYAVLTQSPDGPRQTVLQPTAEHPVNTSLPVVSLRLGPLLRKEQIGTVRSLLRSLGHRDVEILTSEVPLR